MSSRLSLVVLIGLLALPVFADVSDDAIKLTQSGVNTEVIVAWAQQQNVGPLSTDAILRLKDAKVSDAVITALTRSASQQQQQTATTATPQRGYIDPTTTYVESSPTYYYSDSYPYYGSRYYDGYGYGSSYYGPSVGLGFSFGGHGGRGGFGGYHGGGGSGYGGYRGGSGHHR